MWPCRVHGFFFSSAAFPGCFCAGMSQAGNFHGKDFSQSEQQIPAGAWGQLLAGQGCWRGQWWMLGNPTSSAQFPPSLEMQMCLPIVPGQGGPGVLWGSGEAVGGLGDQKLHLSEKRTWPWTHFLQPHVRHEGEPPQIPSSGGAVPARPRFSGLWRPPSLGGRWHC